MKTITEKEKNTIIAGVIADFDFKRVLTLLEVGYIRHQYGEDSSLHEEKMMNVVVDLLEETIKLYPDFVKN
ncbi:MAG: hypothetical protein WD512_20930, partial [Candidatus Paceibacterota bacterium]